MKSKTPPRKRGQLSLEEEQLKFQKAYNRCQ